MVRANSLFRNIKVAEKCSPVYLRMSHIALLIIFYLLPNYLNGQIGINQTTPHASAALDIHSTTKGFLIPRMNLAQRNSIISPANGLLIYQTNNSPGYYYFDGLIWRKNYVLNSFLNDSNGDTEIATEKNNDEDKIRFKLAGHEKLILEQNPNFRINIIAPNNNLFFGIGTGINALFGTDNIGIGDGNLMNVNGSRNIAIGPNALHELTSGNDNIAVGIEALQNVQLGSNNTAIGNASLKNSLTLSNTAIGLAAIKNNVNGFFNTAVGALSMELNTSGSQNTGIGFKSFYNNISGNNNTAVGSLALANNTSGSRNTSVGSNALNANQNGSDNTGIGYAALQTNVSGNNNTAIGSNALEKLSAGSNNTAIGTFAMRNLIIGGSNTAIGFASLLNSNNIIGNTGIGVQSLYQTTGNYNTAIGYLSLYNNTSGSNNTGLGFRTLYNNTSGSNNTGLGSYADVSTGNLINGTAIGSRALVGASNALILGPVAGNNGAVVDATVFIGQTPSSGVNQAVLELNGTKGLLIPRMTNAQRNAIVNPAEGLLVYSTTNHNFWMFDGTTWENFADPIGNLTAQNGEGLTYNDQNNNFDNFIPGFSNRIIDADGDSRAEVDFSSSGHDDYSNFRVKLRDTSVFLVSTEVPFFTSTNIDLGYKLNIFFGENAGQSFNPILGLKNHAYGFSAMRDLGEGSNNVAVGASALLRCPTCSDNVSLGKSASDSLYNSNKNVALGVNSLRKYSAQESIGVGFRSFEEGRNQSIALGSYSEALSDYSNAIGSRAVSESISSEASMVLGAIGGVNGAIDDTKVGIGTTAPNAMMHIVKNESQEAISQLILEDSLNENLELEFKNVAQSEWFMRAKPLGTASSSTLTINYGSLNNAGTEILTVRGNGNTTLTGSLTQNSDIRLKKDIQPLEHMLSKVKKLRGVTYHWKDINKDQTMQYGFIAQEVKKAFPDLVHVKNDIHRINYSGMTAVLLSAINEENTNLEKQERQLDENVKLIHALEEALAKLEKDMK